MNRAHRLLSIYTRLIHHQKIDKALLADEFNVNERTIKRDIQEIRNYFYDNDEWLMKKDILFNYKDNHYLIQYNHQIKYKEGFEILLIYLSVNKAVLPNFVKEALRYVIFELFPTEKKQLESYLENIKCTGHSVSHTLVLKLYQSIENKQCIDVTTDSGNILKLFPIKVVLYKEDWHLVYRGEDLLEQYLPLNQIQHVETNEKTHHHFRNKMEVILEMNDIVWSRIKDLYHVNQIIDKKEKLYTINFNITSIEAFELCLLYSPHIRIVGPQSLFKQFVTYISQLCQVYLYREIP